jgi:hypothetical protein
VNLDWPRQPDRIDDAVRRAARETGRDRGLWIEFSQPAFPSRDPDASGPRGVADVFGEQSFQMAFVHSDDLIQKVPSAAFPPSAPPHRSATGSRRRFGQS